jgi:hypothetical protein
MPPATTLASSDWQTQEEANHARKFSQTHRFSEKGLLLAMLVATGAFDNVSVVTRGS